MGIFSLSAMMRRAETIDLDQSHWGDIPVEDLEQVFQALASDEGMDVDSGAMPSSASNFSDVFSAGNSPAPRPTGFVPFQPEPSNDVKRSQEIITQINHLYEHQRDQLGKMSELQTQICELGSSSDELKKQQYLMSQQIQEELKQLRELNRSVVLQPNELHRSRILGQRLQIQQQLLEIYSRELNTVGNPDNGDSLDALVIEDQPIPQVTFKNKALEDNYTVRLLSGAGTKYKNISKIKAQLVSEDNTWKKTTKPLDNDETSMDFYHRIATFHHLKVQVSTRMSAVYLKFGIQVQQENGVSPVIQSHPSYPLIVITNESQWCEAAGKLVIMDSFAGHLEVCWPQFANGLHHHFLKATRQNAHRPARCIKPHEFNFFKRKFFNNQDVITTQQAGRFWGWFGQVTQTLRFKRHISTLWFTGLIYGLISKEECNAALQNQEEGTFLIRFSESYPGLFGVAYVSDDPVDRVKHYLVKPDDTGSQKTLPDFLRDKPQFIELYTLDTNTGQLGSFAKDTVLGSFYSKSKWLDPQQNGYVLL